MTKNQSNAADPQQDLRGPPNVALGQARRVDEVRGAYLSTERDRQLQQLFDNIMSSARGGLK